MRHSQIVILCLLGTVALAGCQKSSDAEVERALKSVNALDESNLSDLMLTAADPNEAVTYFRRTLAENPDRIDLQRGLAKSLVRAKRPTEAGPIWAMVVAHPEAMAEDKVEYADALIRANEWDKARQVLDSVPPTHESFERYRLEAMVADSKKDWARADSFYEIAIGLTTQPSSVLNNWGYSKMTRGDFRDAERLFSEALTYDRNMETAKNNLVMARGAHGNYQMPVIDMTQVERAELLHTMALIAIKRGDLTIGKQLLQEAIDTHPQYFDVAVRALRALEDQPAATPAG
jgi:Tfp pilus assembly protein PilF